MNYIEIKEGLIYGSKVNENMNALFAEGRTKEKWEQISKDPFYKNNVNEIVESANRYLKQPIHSLRFSEYKIYEETGSRKEFEREYFDHRGRLNVFTLVSLIYKDDKYISELEDIIWAICDEYSWCIPPHFEGNSMNVTMPKDGYKTIFNQNRGNIREHEKMIDLFASETGFALSEICSLLEDRINPLVLHRARKLVKERIIESFGQVNSMFWWETTSSNWASVCAGSVGAAAIYLIEDSEALAPILLRICSTMECYLTGFFDDGASTEGLIYWNYGFGFYTYFAELLKQRTGGKIDIMKGEKIHNIASFQQKCYLSGDKIVNFADCVPFKRFMLGLTNKLKERFNDIEVPDVNFREGALNDNCHRWAHAVRNLIWSQPGMQTSLSTESFNFLGNVQCVVSRKRRETGIIAFAAKGGNNAEHHNHNDIGSFILNVNGDSLLAELGMGEYSKQYFGAERYSLFCTGSQGHSVPIIEGAYQKDGIEFKGEILEVANSENKSTFSVDISKAYGNDNLKSLIRTFELIKSPETEFYLRDEFIFEKTPTSITERFISFHKPEILKEGRIQLKGDSGRVNIEYNPEQFKFILGHEKHTNYTSDTPFDVYILDLKLKTLGNKVVTEIHFKIIN